MKKTIESQPITHGFAPRRRAIPYRWLLILLLTTLAKIYWTQGIPIF